MLWQKWQCSSSCQRQSQLHAIMQQQQQQRQQPSQLSTKSHQQYHPSTPLARFLQALVDVLQEGGAPELINLDLRGNTLSDHAQQLLVSKICQLL
jgi:hypothetical protein